VETVSHGRWLRSALDLANLHRDQLDRCPRHRVQQRLFLGLGQLIRRVTKLDRFVLDAGIVFPQLTLGVHAEIPIDSGAAGADDLADVRRLEAVGFPMSRSGGCSRDDLPIPLRPVPRSAQARTDTLLRTGRALRQSCRGARQPSENPPRPPGPSWHWCITGHPCHGNRGISAKYKWAWVPQLMKPGPGTCRYAVPLPHVRLPGPLSEPVGKISANIT